MTDDTKKQGDIPATHPIDSRPLTVEDLQSFPMDFLNIYNLIETVTVAPTGNPTKLFDQIKLYTDSLSAPSVYRLYVYIKGINTWHYVALT